MLDEYGLTQKEREFCDYYLESGNAKQSYLDSFGASSKNSAAVLACNLMKQEHIKNYLSIVNEALSSDRLAKAEEVLIFYTEIMRDKNQSTGDRLKAADALAKRYALFTQKIEANVVSSGNFEINILGDFEDE